MKKLNFNVKEILPSLLDKSKTQTIRLVKEVVESKGSMLLKKGHEWISVELPKYRVGEEVEIVWNKGSKFQWFDSNGDGCNRQYAEFNKKLGTAKITEVFEIEMSQGEWGFRIIPWSDDLATRDGFKSAEEMFNFFDKAYGINTPKKFYVYRWEWK